MAYSFFENSRVTDDSYSFLAEYNTTYNAYSFSNISRLITNLKNKRDREARVTPQDSEAVRKAKWAAWEAQNPDWNKVYLIPVDVVTTTSTNSYGVVSTVIHSVKNQLGMYSTMLKGGPQGLVKMDVVYVEVEHHHLAIGIDDFNGCRVDLPNIGNELRAGRLRCGWQRQGLGFKRSTANKGQRQRQSDGGY